MGKLILITGVNGFVGKHLVRELVSREFSVCGVGSTEDVANSEIANLLSNYYKCDVTSPEQVQTLPLQSVDAVINLAGLANVGASFDNPELYMKVNVEVLSALGNALFDANPRARMIAVSTGALYQPDQPMPLNENSQVVTNGSPYALSKLAMEQAAHDLRKKGQDCVVVRPFNHIGPGQGLGFLIPDLINKLRQTSKSKPSIKAGNLKTVRDYSDVRDIVTAYASLATADNLTHNLYNVCSGVGLSGEEIVKSMCENMDISFTDLNIEIDESLIRPTDPKEIIGDNSRIQNAINWKPNISLDQTIKSIVLNT